MVLLNAISPVFNLYLATSRCPHRNKKFENHVGINYLLLKNVLLAIWKQVVTIMPGIIFHDHL